MALTNAEHQARWRARRKQEMTELRAGRAQLDELKANRAQLAELRASRAQLTAELTPSRAQLAELAAKNAFPGRLSIVRRKDTGALTISGRIAGKRIQRRARTNDPELAALEARLLEAKLLLEQFSIEAQDLSEQVDIEAQRLESLMKKFERRWRPKRPPDTQPVGGKPGRRTRVSPEER